MSAVTVQSDRNAFYIPFTERRVLRVTDGMLSNVDRSLDYLNETGGLQERKKLIADSMKTPIVDEKNQKLPYKDFLMMGLLPLILQEDGILSLHNIKNYLKHINLLSFLIFKNSEKTSNHPVNLQYLLELRYRHLFSYNHPSNLKSGVYSECNGGILPLQANYRTVVHIRKLTPSRN